MRATGLKYENQVVEAAFRKALVYCEDDRTYMRIPKKFQDLFVPIRPNRNRLYFYNALFDLWKHFYLTNVWMVPFLVLGSGLFVGLLTFGVMMQVNDAFTRVNNTVAQFIQNWQIITEVREYLPASGGSTASVRPQSVTDAGGQETASDALP